MSGGLGALSHYARYLAAKYPRLSAAGRGALSDARDAMHSKYGREIQDMRNAPQRRAEGVARYAPALLEDIYSPQAFADAAVKSDFFATLHPGDFEQLAASMGDEPHYWKLNNALERLAQRDEPAFDEVPELYLAQDTFGPRNAPVYRVVSHEGRHRNRALDAEGFGESLVGIRLRDYIDDLSPEMRRRFLGGEATILPEFFNQNTFADELRAEREDPWGAYVRPRPPQRAARIFIDRWARGGMIPS